MGIVWTPEWWGWGMGPLDGKIPDARGPLGLKKRGHQQGRSWNMEGHGSLEWIGAATTAARVGVEDSLRQTMGGRVWHTGFTPGDALYRLRQAGRTLEHVKLLFVYLREW
jgi:hypothetical protein